MSERAVLAILFATALAAGYVVSVVIEAVQ
jgi:hypothetical protein